MSVDSDTIEHMFESTVTQLSPGQPVGTPRGAALGALRQKIRRLEHGQLPATPLPVLPGLERLFPEKGLKPGAVYSLSPHTSIVWALISQATQRGHWAASVGSDHLGFHAAIEYGVVTDRLIVLPRLGSNWWSAVSALVDVVSLVVVRPGTPFPSPAARDTLLARARERGCVLLVTGHWPHAHGHISVENTQWTGLGQGNGVLVSHELTLQYTPRHGSRSHQVTLVRDGDGPRVVDTPLTPLRHLTPRAQEGVTTASDHREAG
jgi:membrane protein implicated in regulation of membrane protease activity